MASWARVSDAMVQPPDEPKEQPPSISTLYWASQATMCLSIAAFFFEGGVYNLIYIRRILPASNKEHLIIPYSIVFNTFWVLGLWSYHQAHWTDSGAVPRRWQEFTREVGEALPIAPAKPQWQPGKATWCKKCQAARPERAHHCVLCGICILRMDHHCPWINNCVGFNNHKFFMLLGIYTWLASFTWVLTACPELLYFAKAVTRLEDGRPWSAVEVIDMSEIWFFLISGIMAALVALLLTSLLATHAPLATRNLTTIEDFYENMPNPYDQGGCKENLAQVFGALGLDWFLPIRPWRPLADGVTYPHAGDAYNMAYEESNQSTYAAITSFYTDVEDIGVEKSWRLHYKVRSAMSPSEKGSINPLSLHFWVCGRPQGGRGTEDG